MRDLLHLLPSLEVTGASTFAQGREKILQGGWDIILSDERLPDGRGVDLLSIAGQRDGSTILMLMSAFEDFDMLLHAVNMAHIDHFLAKPWDPADLLTCVEQLLRDRTASGRAAAMRGRPFRRIPSHPARSDDSQAGIRRMESGHEGA